MIIPYLIVITLTVHEYWMYQCKCLCLNNSKLYVWKQSSIFPYTDKKIITWSAMETAPHRLVCGYKLKSNGRSEERVFLKEAKALSWADFIDFEQLWSRPSADRRRKKYQTVSQNALLSSMIMWTCKLM